MAYFSDSRNGRSSNKLRDTTLGTYCVGGVIFLGHKERKRRARIDKYIYTGVDDKMPELELDLWLRPEDVAPESVLVFASEGMTGKIPGKEGEADTPTFEIDVQLPNSDTRKWTMNKSSQRAVAQIYGINTDLWVGKSVEVYVSKQNVHGQEKYVIYARVPKQPPAAAK